MANHKDGKERSADQMMAAIQRFRVECPNEYNTVAYRPFAEGIAKIERFLRAGE